MWFRSVELLRIGVVLFGLLLLPCAHGQSRELGLSAADQAWLDDHPVVRMGIDAGYGPYSFLDADGQLQGVVADYLADIEQLLNIRFKIISNLSWPQLMNAVRSRQLDAVATVVKLPEREAFFAFTDVYLQTPLVVMTRNDTAPLRSLAELRKLRLSLVKGYSSSKQLQARFPSLHPLFVDTPIDGLRKVASGSADAYIGVLGVNSFLVAQNGITNIKVNAAFDMEINGQRFGVRKDWPQLASLLDRALQNISTERKNAIFRRWLPMPLDDISRLDAPSYMTRMFPWLLGILGLALVAYLFVWVWNRQLKAELVRRSADLERAQRVAHIGDWSMEISSGRIHWSDEIYRIAGREPQSVGLDWPTLREWIHPQNREEHELYLQQLSVSKPGDQLPPLISHLVRPDGESRWLEIRSQVEFDAADRPLRYYGTAQEMTERIDSRRKLAQSEDRLRMLVGHMPDLVWLKDPDGVYLACNSKFELFFGASQDEIVGKTDYDFLDKELADFFREKDRAAIKAGTSVMNEEEVTYAEDGHKEILETVKTPMRSADGHLIGVLGVGRDITARKEAEQALRRSQKMDAIGQLTGGIAHDFNNILGIILGAVELLTNAAGADESVMKRAATIKKAARRASELTQQLLGFSHNQVAHSEVTDLNREIAAMENLIARSLTPQVEVDYLLTDRLWLTEIDPGDFQDALLNLVINARDAMDGIGQLTIETRNSTLDAGYCSQKPGLSPGDYVQLAVSDSGSGIPTQLQERIFEPFFTTKGMGKGTGLGLAMVYGFVKRSGGDIRFYSEAQIGTTFRIYLPKATHNVRAEAMNEPAQVELPKGHETLLLVDDEEDLLELASDFLKTLGYRVLAASGGRQALDVLDDEPDISLLFSDVVMPGGMNGYELAEEACKRRPGLKVLLNSGFTERAVSHNGQARFNANLLSKPYTQAELARRVRSLLDG